jgi:hypothetical protein
MDLVKFVWQVSVYRDIYVGVFRCARCTNIVIPGITEADK